MHFSDTLAAVRENPRNVSVLRHKTRRPAGPDSPPSRLRQHGTLISCSCACPVHWCADAVTQGRQVSDEELRAIVDEYDADLDGAFDEVVKREPATR